MTEIEGSMDMVEKYYDRIAQYEWERMERHPIEFAVTFHALSAYMPPPPAAVLDMGGGPGRYAIELARRGYAVTLADLSNGNLSLARQKASEAGVKLEAAVHANVLALESAPLPHRTYDTALLMGPLYHLLEREERERAIRQTLARLIPGGLLFAAFVTRYAAVRDVAWRNPGDILEAKQSVEYVLDTGRLEFEEDKEENGFTRAYLAHPGEIIPMMEACGLRSLALVGVEGVITPSAQAINQLTGAAWEAWVAINYRIGCDPCMHGSSDHLLYIGRKADAR